MLFLVIGTDRPDKPELRQQHRPRHLEYWNSLGTIVKLGGPVLQADTPEALARGSLLIIEAADLKAAEGIAQADPFATEGVFSTVKVEPLRVTLGVWAGS